MYRPNRQLLLDCRNGKYSFEEAIQMINEYKDQLNVAYKRSELPETPDDQQINQLLIELNQAGLSLSNYLR